VDNQQEQALQLDASEDLERKHHRKSHKSHGQKRQAAYDLERKQAKAESQKGQQKR
jgi:hypothetical protein